MPRTCLNCTCTAGLNCVGLGWFCTLKCADEWEAVLKAMEADEPETLELDIESMQQVQDGRLK